MAKDVSASFLVIGILSSTRRGYLCPFFATFIISLMWNVQVCKCKCMQCVSLCVCVCVCVCVYKAAYIPGARYFDTKEKNTLRIHQINSALRLTSGQCATCKEEEDFSSLLLTNSHTQSLLFLLFITPGTCHVL